MKTYHSKNPIEMKIKKDNYNGQFVLIKKFVEDYSVRTERKYYKDYDRMIKEIEKIGGYWI